MQMCFLGSQRAGACREQAQKVLLVFGEGLFFEEKEKKKGGFRGRLDECVDGGILIGVILT